jgi:hypothetical protein
MESKIFIVQSLGYEVLETYIKNMFPEVVERISYSDSFDQTIEMIQKEEGRIYVFTSDMFHDISRTQLESTTIPDKEKNSNSLAKMIKEINPNAKVYVYSYYEPPMYFVDGYLHKIEGSNVSINELINFIKKLK